MDDAAVIAWLKDALKDAGKNRTWLAAVLGVNRVQATRIFGKGLKKGGKPRKLLAGELDKICEALGVPNPFDGDVSGRLQALRGLPMMGRLAENVWSSDGEEPNPRESVDLPSRIGGIIHPAYPLGVQKAYQVDRPGLKGEIFAIGDYVIVVPFKNYRTKPLPEDLVIVRRKRSGFSSLGLRRAVIIGDQMNLEPVLQNSVKKLEPDHEIIGLVIGMQKLF